MSDPKVKKIKQIIDDYFLNSKNLQDKAIYQFFSKEIKSKDILGTQIDIPLIGKSTKKRRYVFAAWRLRSFYQTIPWVRVEVPDNGSSASIEVVLPVFHGDMPKFWSKGKSYFRLILQYKAGKHGATFRLLTNEVSTEDILEILEVLTNFHRKIKIFEASSKR